MLTQVPTSGETGFGPIDGEKEFEAKRIKDLADINKELIYCLARDVCIGDCESGESIRLNLVPPLWVNDDRTINNREEYEKVVEGTLQQLGDYFEADNKFGRQEDDGRIIRTGHLIEGGQPFRLTIITSYNRPEDSGVDSGELPISAVAYINKTHRRLNALERTTRKSKNPLIRFSRHRSDRRINN